MQLNEKNLRASSLKYLVEPVVEIDMYSPKIQQDSIVVVVRVDASYDAGYDFSSFIEKLPFGVLDTEVQEVPNADGFYEVFIEMERNEEFPENLVRVLQDASSLCAEEESEYVWKCLVYGHEEEDPMELDADVLRANVRLVPEKEIREFFEYSLEKVVINENVVVGQAAFNSCSSITDKAAAALIKEGKEIPHRLGRYYEAYSVPGGVVVTHDNGKCLYLRD